MRFFRSAGALRACAFLAAAALALGLVELFTAGSALQRMPGRSLRGSVQARADRDPAPVRARPEYSPEARAVASAVPLATTALAVADATLQRCLADAECCSNLTSSAACDDFCRQGSEIAAHGDAGWKVGGVCAPKWQGFCLEDEECQNGHICHRPLGVREGTCRADARCAPHSCSGGGSCRDGRCTCHFGFVGPACERSTDAFAFLIYGNRSENFVSARVLVRSLRSRGSKHDVVALVPEAYRATTPIALLGILEVDGIKVRYTRDIPMPPSMDADPIIHKRWAGVMNKFAVWQLVEYSRVAILDLDIVVDTHGDHPADLFAECKSALCAVRDGDPRFMNAGVMVLSPSESRLAHIQAALQDEHHRYEMPEQSFLTRYCERKENGLELMYLDKKWNSCVAGGTLFNKGWAASGFNMLHSCSWGAKPANVRMCFSDSCDEAAERHTVLVWQRHHAALDPCIRHRQERTCSASGMCSWCGHYCSDSRMPCSARLMKEEIEMPKADNATAVAASRASCHTRARGSSWDTAPAGWWAWPRAALYQVLIDRFASSQPEACDDLRSHCGGDFAGIRDKLSYLDTLAVDGIMLSPVVENMPGGYHGYLPKDLDAINPRFGSEEELKDLVFAAHQRHMKVMVDVNLNHAGGPGVEVADLIPQLRPFSSPEHFHSPNCSLFSPDDFKQDKRVMEDCQLFGLPDYNHSNPEVWRGLKKWFHKHVASFGFDGVRIDAAHHMPKSFLRDLASEGAPVPAFHEVISSDANSVGTYATGDYDSVYNYPLYFILRAVFADMPMESRRPLSDLVEVVPRADSDRKLLLNFLDNNDMPRFARMARNEGSFRNALLYVLGAEGVPVLLYGSEQGARGVETSADPVREEPPDQWRPALWDVGYNTTGETFRMVQRVLWLRKRFDGFHRFRQRIVHSDHEVLVSSRGPFFFVVNTMSQHEGALAQRVLWHNETSDECGAASSRRCNLLAEDVLASCRVVTPGLPDYLEVRPGEPQLDAPEEFAEAMLEELARAEESQHVAEPAERQLADAGAEVYSQARWREMPGVELVDLSTVERIPRSPLAGAAALNDPDAWRAAEGVDTPWHLTSFAPPLGVPAFHTEHFVAKGGCFRKIQEHPSVIYTRSGPKTHVLCAHESAAWCDLAARQISASESGDLQIGGPVLHLSYGALFQGGFYHVLVQMMPYVVPHLRELRAGTMKLFIEYDVEIIKPVLQRLGIAEHTFGLPKGASDFGFCASEIHVRRHQGYANNHPSRSMLRGFRRAMRLRSGGDAAAADDDLEADPEPTIVLLSRGESGTRSLSNEGDLVAALEALGRRVDVLRPGEATLQLVVETLRRADVIVGVHGANLANMIFAPEGTKVIEIVPQVEFRMENHHYWTLAGALEFPYRPVPQVIQRLANDAVRAPMRQNEAVGEFAVEVGAVVAAVKDLIDDDFV